MFDVSAPEDTDPDVPVCHGDPAIEMEHAVAFVEDHAMVEEAPETTVVGEADKVRVGRTGGTTAIVMLCVPDEPPSPEQLPVKVVLAISAPEDTLPDISPIQ